MDMDKTPHLTDIEKINIVQDSGFTELQRVLIEEIVNKNLAEHRSDKRWYDDIGCVMVWLIVCSMIVLITMINAGVIK